MSLDQVIEAGSHHHPVLFWFISLLCAGLALIGIFMCIRYVRLRTTLKFVITITCTTALLVSSVTFFYLSLFKDQRDKMDWTNNRVIPYLEQLPLQKAEIKEIEYIGMDPDADKFLVKMTLLKSDKRYQKTTAWVSVEARLESEKSNHVVYRELTKNLPRGIENGFFRAVIHVDISEFSLATLELRDDLTFPALATYDAVGNSIFSLFCFVLFLLLIFGCAVSVFHEEIFVERPLRQVPIPSLPQRVSEDRIIPTTHRLYSTYPVAPTRPGVSSALLKQMAEKQPEKKPIKKRRIIR